MKRRFNKKKSSRTRFHNPIPPPPPLLPDRLSKKKITVKPRETFPFFFCAFAPRQFRFRAGCDLSTAKVEVSLRVPLQVQCRQVHEEIGFKDRPLPPPGRKGNNRNRLEVFGEVVSGVVSCHFVRPRFSTAIHQTDHQPTRQARFHRFYILIGFSSIVL